MHCVYLAPDGFLCPSFSHENINEALVQIKIDRIFYNEMNQELLLLHEFNPSISSDEPQPQMGLYRFHVPFQHNQPSVILDQSNLKTPQLLFPSTQAAHFKYICESLNRRFLACQVVPDGTQVYVIDRVSSKSFCITIKYPRTNRILSRGLIWNTHSTDPLRSQDLMIITTLGIEHYRVSSARQDCKYVKVYQYNIYGYWYTPKFQVLVVASISPASNTILRAYVLGDMHLGKIHKLDLTRRVDKHDIEVLDLYDCLYILVLDRDVAVMNIQLYGVTRHLLEHVITCSLDAPDDSTRFHFFGLDNLLICYNCAYQVGQFYDLEGPSSSKDVSDLIAPFTNPLPIGHMEDTDNFQWIFLPPAHVLQLDRQTKNVRAIRSLRLDLKQIQSCVARHPDMIPFLLRRGQGVVAKCILFQYLTEAMAIHDPIECFIQSFQLMHQDHDVQHHAVENDDHQKTEAVTDLRNKNGQSIILSEECFNAVWKPAFENSVRFVVYLMIDHVRTNRLPIQF